MELGEEMMEPVDPVRMCSDAAHVHADFWKSMKGRVGGLKPLSCAPRELVPPLVCELRAL